MYSVEINGRTFGVRHHSFYSALEFASHQAKFAGDPELEKQIRSRMDVPSINRKITFQGKVRVRVEKTTHNK